METLEVHIVRRVAWRLIPLLMLCYLVAYVDRVNLSFAGLEMNRALGFSASVFGFGAGMFFIGYLLCEVPSNWVLSRVGARRWIARIMVSWGLASGTLAFISGTTGFYVVRLLLGAAEAGLFPGVIYFLTLWFPSAYRARITGRFMMAMPLALAITSPISGSLLYVHGLGLAGWQWMFILEAVPSIVVAGVVFLYLTDYPAEATWLAADERNWLVARLEAERRQREAGFKISFWQALVNRRVLVLVLIYYPLSSTVFANGYWMPQIVKGMGLTNFQTGLVIMVPYAIGVFAMLWYPRLSDRRGERKRHCAFALFLCMAGLALSTTTNDPVLKLAALSLSTFGQFAALPVFWSLPGAFLSGPAAASGIAVINSLGAFSGFGTNNLMGILKDWTGSYSIGILVVASLLIVAIVTVLLLRDDPALERVPVENMTPAKKNRPQMECCDNPT